MTLRINLSTVNRRDRRDLAKKGESLRSHVRRYETLEQPGAARVPRALSFSVSRLRMQEEHAGRVRPQATPVPQDKVEAKCPFRVFCVFCGYNLPVHETNCDCGCWTCGCSPCLPLKQSGRSSASFRCQRRVGEALRRRRHVKSYSGIRIPPVQRFSKENGFNTPPRISRWKDTVTRATGPIRHLLTKGTGSPDAPPRR